MPNIDIQNFEGVWTNADAEDIPKEFLTELKNLRPINGKLQKTFGPGEYLTKASPAAFDNLFVFVDEGFQGGRMRIAVYVNPTTNAVSVYTYDESIGWAIDESFAGFYHRKGKNPILKMDRVLRILPGDAGMLNGNEAKGIWFGWIDRKLFDGTFAFTAQHYAYPTEIVSPNIDLTTTLLNNGPYNPDGTGEKKYYRLSYIYDGEQESLLGNNIEECDFGQNQLPKFSFTVIKAIHNKRITAIKVYRADRPEGPYNYIHTINFLRPAGGAFRKASGGAWTARYKAYVPGLSTYDFNAGYSYQITIDGQAYQIATPTGSGNEVFALSNPTEAISDKWDTGWSLQHDTGGGWSGTGVSGTNGAFIGEHIIITDTDMSGSNLEAGYLLYDGTYWRNIVDNAYKAVRFNASEANLGTDSGEKSWAVVRETSGLFFVDDNLDGTLTYTFFDPGLLEGTEFKLWGKRRLCRGDRAGP